MAVMPQCWKQGIRGIRTNYFTKFCISLNDANNIVSLDSGLKKSSFIQYAVSPLEAAPSGFMLS